MSYVIVGSCVKDAICTEVCPVDCIHPGVANDANDNAAMLYIDPVRCIDCHACADACPIDAIYPDKELPDHLVEYAAINAAYFHQRGAR